MALGGSLHRLHPNTMMIGASPSGAAVPVPACPEPPCRALPRACPPATFGFPGGLYLGKPSVPSCCCRQPGWLLLAWGNLAMMGIQPQTPAGFIPEPPSIPVDTHGQALPHLFPHLPFNSFLHFSSSSINALSSPSPDLSLAVICGYCSKVAAM